MRAPLARAWLVATLVGEIAPTSARCPHLIDVLACVREDAWGAAPLFPDAARVVHLK